MGTLAETDVSPGRRVSLARTERALVGALTVLELLRGRPLPGGSGAGEAPR